jgi:predicted ArsR family transcriptional regulator
MRVMTVKHRPAEEIDRLLLLHLHASREGMDAAELAMRVGCGAGRVRHHLARLEREGHACSRLTTAGARWTAGS